MKYLLLAVFTIFNLLAAAHDVTPTNEFKVSGKVKKEAVVTITDVLKRKQEELGNVKILNHHGEDKDFIKNIKGVLLKDVLMAVTFDYEKPKELSEFYFVLTASDGYTNVYSWNELYNTPLGDKVYIITEKDGIAIGDMDSRIQVISLMDHNSGRRHMKGLASIEVRRAK